MIEIHIKVGKIDGEDKIADIFNCKDMNLGEAAAVVYRLEQIKQDLLNRDFEVDFYAEKR